MIVKIKRALMNENRDRLYSVPHIQIASTKMFFVRNTHGVK